MFDAPRYRNVAEKIESRIAQGRYVPGNPLPPENALEEEFGVSRITIRQALGLLKRRGILVSRSGAGTFVRQGATDNTGLRFTGSLSELVYYAARTRYEPLGRELVGAPSDIAPYLAAGDDTRTYCFSGRRGWPAGNDFCFEQIFVPEALGRDLNNSELGSAPLFTQLESRNGIKISEVEQITTAVLAGKQVARELGLNSRQPVLKATRVYRLDDGRVAEVAVSHYHPDRFQYVMNLFLE